jgi:penicillin amidase
MKGFTGGVLDGTKRNKIEPKGKDTIWAIENPLNNFLFSANQQPKQNGFYFGAHWHKDDFRVNHIYKLLKERNNWDITHIQEMQNDRVDYSYKTYDGLFNKFNIYKSNTTIKTYLKDWDGKIISNSAKAHVFEVLRKSTSEVAENFAAKYLQVQQRPSIKSFLKYLNNEKIQVADSPDKSFLLKQVLKRMDSVLTNDIDFKNEKYNTKSEFEIYNISFLPGFNEQITGMGGNKNTINMNADAHPAFRAIFELSKKGIKGYTIMAGGQSGCINSQNYKDQLTKWKVGKYNITQYVEQPKDLKNIKTKILFKK